MLPDGVNCCSVVSVHSANEDCVAKDVILHEYLGMAVDEQQQMLDMQKNPHMSNHHRFTFDAVYDIGCTQDTVYQTTAKPAVLSVLEGYNATIFAYGQTGTGKTFTMEGFRSSTDPARGIIPRSMEEIFSYIQSEVSDHSKFMVRASYLQIYNETISDLLKTERTSLLIREDPKSKRGVFVEGLSEWAVRSPAEIYNLILRGQQARV